MRKIVEIVDGLPQPHRDILPDCEFGKGHLAAKKQLTTISNVEALLEFCGVEVRFNLMTKTVELSVVSDLEEGVAFGVIDNLAQRVGMSQHREVEEHVRSIALANPYHPAAAYIDSKPWDGKDRLEELYGSLVYASAEDALATRLFLRRWLIQGVEAVFGHKRPQPKPFVFVLCGPQGIGKTRWVRSLLPEEYTQVGMSLHLNSPSARDSMHQATCRVITELGEVETTFSKSDQGALKNFLSRPVDTYRLPYARREQNHPRMTIFAATVNYSQTLQDPSGSRRFGMVVVEACKPLQEKREKGYTRLNRQQLFAQVKSLWEAGEQWWFTPDEEAVRVARADDFVSSNEVEDRLSTYFLPLFERPSDVDHWVPLTFTELAELCRFSPQPRNVVLVSLWLEKHGHKRVSRYVDRDRGYHKQKCWVLPVRARHAILMDEARKSEI
jgi:predicted P-loop ATPase